MAGGATSEVARVRLLYMSCHEILEYDELRMFYELGHEIYSLGAYTHPGGIDHRKRPPLPYLPYDPHFIELATRYGKELHPEMLLGIDVVVIMHTPEFINSNFEVLRQHVGAGGRVVWRSIGQSVPGIEAMIAFWKQASVVTDVVRYSPHERTIQGYAGEDALIRFCKRPDEFPAWQGTQPVVINFTQSILDRGRFVGYDYWEQSTHGLNRVVYGPGNEELLEDGGLLSYQDQLKVFSEAKAYIYAGTYPASYTLTIMEAMLVGIPTVVAPASVGNGPMFSQQRTYEVCDWFEDLDLALEPAEANRTLAWLLSSTREDMEDLSQVIRARGRELFDESVVALQWAELLGGGRAAG